MIAKLITKLFGFILGVISTIIQIFLTPISAIFNNILPDLHTWAVSIENFINTYIPKITYFLSWLGPFTISVIRLEMSLISIFFTAYATYLVYHTTIYLLHKFKIIN